MSDTPRTDALSATFYLRCDDCPQPDKCERMVSLHPDDGRQLERELSSAEARTLTLQSERDEARATFGALHTGAERWKKRAESAEARALALETALRELVEKYNYGSNTPEWAAARALLKERAK